MQTSEQQDKSVEAQQPLPLKDLAVATFQHIRQLVADIVAVAAIETRLISLTITAIVILAQVSAFLATACWLLVNAAAYHWLVSMGYDSVYTLLGFAAANLAGALIAIFAILRLSRRFYFSATRKALGLIANHDNPN